MKIATSTVSYEGYGDSAAFESQFAAFKEALEKAKREGVQLLCLPGGYFWVKSDAEFKNAQNRVVQEARRTGIAIAVGIDYSQTEKSKKEKTRSPSSESLVRTKALPSFAVAWSPRQHKKSWRQRSVNSKDQRLVSEQDCKKPQVLRVSGRPIEILTCGELFNECIRDSIIARHPSAVVGLSHIGKGFRANRSLQSLARKGMYTFCCTHANLKGAMKRAFAPGGRKISTRRIDFLTTGEPRIEMKSWAVI
jgi:hypothetical protein